MVLCTAFRVLCCKAACFGLVGVVVVVMGGCSADANRSLRSNSVIADSVGAVDDRYRRAGGQDGDNIFREMDFPTPNDQRLGSGKPGPGYW